MRIGLFKGKSKKIMTEEDGKKELKTMEVIKPNIGSSCIGCKNLQNTCIGPKCMKGESFYTDCATNGHKFREAEKIL